MRAYIKRLAERLSAHPGAYVTERPVQQADRQLYGNGSVYGVRSAAQLQSAGLGRDGRSERCVWEPRQQRRIPRSCNCGGGPEHRQEHACYATALAPFHSLHADFVQGVVWGWHDEGNIDRDMTRERAHRASRCHI